MLRVTLACVICLAAACDGEGSTALSDAPMGPPCTGALYDGCTVAADCMSQNCHFYEMSNFTVCTQSCSTTIPCPNDSAGNPVTCNNNGLCKPAHANICTP